MTFALSPWVAWLLVAAASAVAVAVFVIRPRPRRQVVASIAVWQRVVDEVRQRSLWARLRWVCSLLLTALIAAAMAAALTRPGRTSRPGTTDRALVILDSSWSMRARTAPGRTRWDRAVSEAQAIAGASSAGEIAVATTGEGIVLGPTADRALVRRALDGLEPTGGADGAWPSVADARSVHFFTDGARPRAMPAGVTVHSVFAPADNVALTAFDVESSGDTAEVFLTVTNFGQSARTVQVTIDRGDAPILDRSLSLAAGERHLESMAVPTAGEARFRAHIASAGDALAIDDDAVGWLWAAEPVRVGAVGAGGLVPALLSRDKTLRVSVVEPARYAPGDADVWVFDNWLPASAPDRPALLIDPPSSTWLGARDTAEPRPAWHAGRGHPILDGVEAAMAGVGAARAVRRPSLQAIASSDRGTPLVSVEDGAAGRYVVLHFAPGEAAFASTPAFPILIGNAVDWLGRPERSMHRQPGPITLPAATRRVVAPSGRVVPLVRLEDRVSAVLPGPGLYLAETAAGANVVSVALGDPDRSNLRVSSLAEPGPDGPPGRGAPRAWWIVLVAAGLALAALEWVTWRRRITV